MSGSCRVRGWGRTLTPLLQSSTPIINESNSINTPFILVEVLQEETFLANINNNEELLLAKIIIPDLDLPAN